MISTCGIIRSVLSLLTVTITTAMGQSSVLPPLQPQNISTVAKVPVADGDWTVSIIKSLHHHGCSLDSIFMNKNCSNRKKQ